jgi:hypothetical protein
MELLLLLLAAMTMHSSRSHLCILFVYVHCGGVVFNRHGHVL